MSRLQPGSDNTGARHGAIPACPDQPAPDSGSGWCLPCYEHGAFTLASGPRSSTCVLHGELLAQGLPPTHLFATADVTRPPRSPRGKAFRDPNRDSHRGPSSRPGRLSRPTARARARARALALGRERARQRLLDARFQPHPGWRNFVDSNYRVLVSQPEAQRYLARRIDDEDWRSDKRRSWTLILHRLVRHMDWETGLISGVTVDRLAAAGDRAPRTVSRAQAWARESGGLVVVECGASAEFLGTETGRAPTYALVTTEPQAEPADVVEWPVDESGDLPTSLVNTNPLLRGTRSPLATQPKWPAHSIPTEARHRSAATSTLINSLGLDGRNGRKITIWRARALLKQWWDDGVSVAGLLYAVEFHPDRQETSRGDITTGVKDPIAVLGARLRPWQGRLGELPAHVTGHRMTVEPQPARRPVQEPVLIAEPGVRQLAREALRQHLEELREKRRAQGREVALGLPVSTRTYDRVR